MYGRYGTDELNLVLMILGIIVMFLSRIFWFWPLAIISYALYIYALFRMFSRNVYKRREENGKYIRARYKVSAALRVRHERWVQRKDYKFFTCPNCKTALRVPRGHGKVNIVCRKCGTSFTGKT